MVMHNYDGLAKELAPFLEELGVTDIQSYSKYQIKKIAKQKILQKQKTELMTQAQRYMKISPKLLSQEEFRVHDYLKSLTVSEARFRFRLYSRMTPRVATCWKGERKYREMEYQCIAHREAGEPVTEDNRDTEEHIMHCIFYSDLRSDLSLSSHRGLVQYFRRVICRRAEMENYSSNND